MSNCRTSGQLIVSYGKSIFRWLCVYLVCLIDKGIVASLHYVRKECEIENMASIYPLRHTYKDDNPIFAEIH